MQLAALITQGADGCIAGSSGPEPSSARPSRQASCQEPPAETWPLSAHHSPGGRPDEGKAAWCPHEPSVNPDQPAQQEGPPSEQILLLVIISAFSLTRLSTLLQHCGKSDLTFFLFLQHTWNFPDLIPEVPSETFFPPRVPSYCMSHLLREALLDYTISKVAFGLSFILRLFFPFVVSHLSYLYKRITVVVNILYLPFPFYPSLCSLELTSGFPHVLWLDSVKERPEVNKSGHLFTQLPACWWLCLLPTTPSPTPTRLLTHTLTSALKPLPTVHLQHQELSAPCLLATPRPYHSSFNPAHTFVNFPFIALTSVTPGSEPPPNNRIHLIGLL